MGKFRAAKEPARCLNPYFVPIQCEVGCAPKEYMTSTPAGCLTSVMSGIEVHSGIFRADMQITLVNDGPVTLLLDSRKQF